MKKNHFLKYGLLAAGLSLGLVACQQTTVDPSAAAATDDLTSLVAAARGIAGGDTTGHHHGDRPRLTEVATTDLPAAVLAYVTANYTGATLEKAAKDDTGKLAVLIKKADGTMAGLVFDASGNFVQELTKGGRGSKDGKGKMSPDSSWHGHHGTALTAVQVASLPGTCLLYTSPSPRD